MRAYIGNYPERGEKRVVEIEIDDWDDYSADSTIALIAVPILKKLKTRKLGVPGFCFPNGGSDDYEEDDFAEAEKMWEDVLDKMIWSLEQVVEETDRPFLMESYRESEELKQKWLEDNRTYENRLQEGLELFGKHFKSLWW